MKQRYIPGVRHAYRLGWDWQVEKIYVNGRDMIYEEGWAPTKKLAEGFARRSANRLQAMDDAAAAPWSEVVR